MANELDAKSLDIEFEREFETISLSNDNTIDIYFKILSALGNDEKNNNDSCQLLMRLV